MKVRYLDTYNPETSQTALLEHRTSLCSPVISVFINCVSVRLSTALSVVFTTGKVLALVAIIVTGLVKLAQGEWTTKKVSNFHYLQSF